MTEHEHTPRESQRLADLLVDSATADQIHQREHAERVAVPSAIARQRVVHVALAMAVPILIAVLLVNFAWQPLMSLFEDRPSPAIASQQAQEMLDALVIDIDAFQDDYNELPATLVDIGVPPRGEWSYAVLGHAQYKVRGTLYGQVVSFDSTGRAKPVKERR
jgi:hypothetical protein